MVYLFNVGHRQWNEGLLLSLEENEHLPTRLTRSQSHLPFSFHLVSLNLVGSCSGWMDVCMCDNPKLVVVSFYLHRSFYRLVYPQRSVELLA